jgi:hypothetical protein
MLSGAAAANSDEARRLEEDAVGGGTDRNRAACAGWRQAKNADSINFRCDNAACILRKMAHVILCLARWLHTMNTLTKIECARCSVQMKNARDKAEIDPLIRNELLAVIT